MARRSVSLSVCVWRIWINWCFLFALRGHLRGIGCAWHAARPELFALDVILSLSLLIVELPIVVHSRAPNLPVKATSTAHTSRPSHSN